MSHPASAVRAVLLCALVATAPSLPAQSAPRRTPDQLRASFAAHKGDFDYLLGDWEFTGVNHDYGRINGFWSAVRLADGQILDEYRIVGDSGVTYYVTRTLRVYNPALDEWDLVSTGNGLHDLGTGRRVGDEMHIDQKFGTMTEQPSTWRIRYHDIQAERFSWSADRSTDDGKSWVAGFQTLEARRIGPPRDLEPLTRTR